jgi:ribosomal protein S18 acetylase RimI-like enzyme
MSIVKFVDQAPDEIEEKMRKDLVAYEASHGIDVNYRKFALILYDDSGEAIGLLNAFTAFSEIYIEDLWVDSSHRGQGHGKTMLKELEEHFKGQGFNNINLVTSQFNAPGFYKKCGFQAEFTRQNRKNPQLTKTFFVKFFENEVQTQGILKEDNIAPCT